MVQNDSHLVSTLFRIHKKAKPANKIWSFYVIDAISREMKSHAKKSKGKEASGKGSSASFLQKMEICLDRIVTENLEKGLPEHRVSLPPLASISFLRLHLPFASGRLRLLPFGLSSGSLSEPAARPFSYDFLSYLSQS